MADKKKAAGKKQPNAAPKKKNDEKWLTGKGVPVDAKKVKWAAKY